MSWNDTVAAEFRAGNERIADMFDRSSLLLLHTIGAKSGQPRMAPVVYFMLGGTLAVIASAAGAPKNPDWYANLVANPAVTIELWRHDTLVTEHVIAEPAQGADRDALWATVAEMAPGFAEYQTKTTRVIPVVRLLPDTAAQ